MVGARYDLDFPVGLDLEFHISCLRIAVGSFFLSDLISLAGCKALQGHGAVRSHLVIDSAIR